MSGTVADGAEPYRSPAQRALLAVELTGASIALLVIVVALAGQFVARYVFGIGWHWAGEVARYAFVWSALLGTAAALEAGQLHRFDIVSRRLPTLLRGLCEAVAAMLVAITLLYLLYYGIVMTDRVVGQRSSILRISMAWVYASVPVVSLLMLLSLGLQLLNRLRGFPAMEKP